MKEIKFNLLILQTYECKKNIHNIYLVHYIIKITFKIKCSVTILNT